MKLYEAKSIITDVFENPFNKEKYSYFIRNLLKNMEPAEFLRAGYNIPKAFEDFIASYERLGKYEDVEGNLIDILIIKLKREHSIDFARSTQRNFVRWYLNDKGKDAALVAFTTEKSSEWRFSFIKMQYSLEKKKDELTPAKRSSFLVGESGKSHTAQRQLLGLLMNDQAPYLSDIEKAFSIEAVSDEFYEKYKNLLFNLADEIEKIVKNDEKVKREFAGKNISILNFSKKLLGQIVFLYFLQKKGWLGLDEKAKYGEGDRNFLRSLFNKTKPGENFFNDYLEYLFYDALSKKRVTDYYERFNTRIPFLNGGLFDPIEFYDWQNTDILIPNNIFSDRKGDEEGTGILDVFDLYNFTVKEDEPLDTEVAIDPEMLGKVFERMLDVTERKSKGTFYTPREIVHYMAQQSLLYFMEKELNQTVSYNKIGSNQPELFGNEVKTGQLDIITENKACAVPKADLETFIHYGEHIIDKDIAIEEGKLSQTANRQHIPESIRQHAYEIDRALENIKICDPAVGSGAFPVGIMNEIVKLRKLLTPFIKTENHKDRSAYHFKSTAIQNCIYGVDIDAGAVEIAKLRLWLSMVVDEERIDSIDPLPNLEYKIVKGNSLINIPDGTAINDALATEIEKLTASYFHITDKEKKQEQKQIIDSKITEQLQFVSEMAGYNIDFDFKLYFHDVFHEKGGFDVVIGNPPYVQLQKDGGKLAKELQTQHFQTFERTGDIYALFYEKGLQLLKQNGHLCFITSNKWMRAGYGKKLRQFFASYNPLLLIDLGPGIFESATVDTNILLIQKSKPSPAINHVPETTAGSFCLKALTLQKQNGKVNIDAQVNEKAVVLTKLSHDAWFIGSYAEQKLKEKIERIGKPLKDWDVKIYRGVLTGLNEAFIISTQKRNEILGNCCSDEERRRTEAIIKPILRGRDIKRYYYEWAGLWVIFIPWHFPLHEDTSIQGASEVAEKEFQNIYPAIYSHLLEYKEPLSKRNKEETGIRYEWYALQRCAATYYSEFEKEKVFFKAVGRNLTFAKVKPGIIVTAPASFLTGHHLIYILGFLCSRFTNYIVEQISDKTGAGDIMLNVQSFERIPLPPITTANEPIIKQIEELVEKILAAKGAGKELSGTELVEVPGESTPANINTSHWEREIDRLVYQLYELTEEEIRIIEK
jgi:hypothetical protein